MYVRIYETTYTCSYTIISWWCDFIIHKQQYVSKGTSE